MMTNQLFSLWTQQRISHKSMKHSEQGTGNALLNDTTFQKTVMSHIAVKEEF